MKPQYIGDWLFLIDAPFSIKVLEIYENSKSKYECIDDKIWIDKRKRKKFNVEFSLSFVNKEKSFESKAGPRFS